MTNNLNIFEKISNNILTEKMKKELLLKNDSKYTKYLNTYSVCESISSEEKESFNLKRELRKYFNRKPKYPEEIGDHPDFKHLKDTNETEKHYIVSIFVDIKGSTKLATIKGLSLDEVREIKNRILTTAISIFQVFDGHIHRLQGDAIFAFFGRKNKKKEEAIIEALNAASILQFIFKNVISPVFDKVGYPKIDIRTGIDFGDNEDVLWSKYGIENCHEITTTSIHTDLAAKLQHKARANSIMIGENIRTELDLPEEFYRIKKRQENGLCIEEEFILKHKEFKYKMWEFNWEKYLGYFQQLPQNPYLPVRYSFAPFQDFEVRCFYNINDILYEYNRNSTALEKDLDLFFELKIINPYLKNLITNVIWEVNNRGVEATLNEKNLAFETPCLNKNFYHCRQMTKYKGHHYMKVKIIGHGRILGEDMFGVFIK